MKIHPYVSAGIGLLLTLPFIVVNAIIALRFEPFFSLIRPGEHTSTLEYVLLAIVLVLFPIALFVTVRPMLQSRTWYVLNTMFAIIILCATIMLWGTFGAEIIACDVLKVPNCD